jgi:hydroxymethylbilane synthase
MHIRVGTRKSELALAQTEIALTNIKRTVSNITFSILPFSTTGDNLYDANLSLIGGKGLFLKELEDKLLNDEIDIVIRE